MAWVTPTVEIAFASTPLAAAPAWVDVSSYVQGPITIKQGRGVELDAPAVGTLQLTLRNRDRRFDPAHASGPYFGNLTQRKRIRVSSGATVLFTGWVRGWPQAVDVVGNNNLCIIQAVDALGMLALSPLAQTPYVAVQLAYKPDGYWRLDDSAFPTSLDYSGHDHHAQYNPTGSRNEVAKGEAPALPLGSGGYLKTLGGCQGSMKVAPIYNGVAPKRYQAISLWTWTQYVSPGMAPAYSSAIGGSPAGLIFASDSRPATGTGDGDLIGYYADNNTIHLDFGNGVYVDYVPDGKSLADGNWHHLFAVVDRTSNLARLYVDGVSQGDKATSGSRGFFETNFAANYYLIYSVNSRQYVGAYFPDAGVAHVAFMQSATSELWSGAAQALYAAGAGWAGQCEAERVSSVLDAAGWPTTLRTAGYQGGPAPTETDLPSDALAYLQSLLRKDGSTLLGMRDGSFKFRNRSELLAATRSQTVQAAFGDDSGFSYRYADIVTALDDEYVYNVVSAKLKDADLSITLHDEASIALYFNRLLDLGEVRAFDELELTSFLGWLLRTYSTPKPRLHSFTVDARADATTLAKVVDLWLGDRITVSFTPLGVGAATVYDQWIESVEHVIDVTAMTWRTTYTTSPAATATLFKIGSSLIGGAAVLGQ